MRAAVDTPVRLLPRLLLATLCAMIALAWLAMWQVGASPDAGYVHQSFLHGPRAVSPLAAMMFVAGWTVMTVAMMLPTSVPLLALFARVVRDRPSPESLVALVAAGYLAVWTAAGVVAYALVVGLQATAHRVPWLHANPWAIGSSGCLVGGVFQFSTIKYACLERCRSIFGFINEHWSGKGERRDAFRLGAHHGIFCVGCCWALMLVMMTLGAGHLGWMLILGTVMALEKNVAWGRAIVKPTGLALLLLGLTIALTRQEMF